MSIHTKGKVKKRTSPAIGDGPRATGEAVITKASGTGPWFLLTQWLVVSAAKFGWKPYRWALALHHGSADSLRVFNAKNLVTDTGLNLLADALNGDDTEINRVALGDDASAAAAGDTQLGNETARKSPSSKAVASNEIFVSTFFTATEAVDTHEEVGHFVGGTDTANSGTLYSRIASPDAADLPVTKTNTDSLTIDYKSTFNAS